MLPYKMVVREKEVLAAYFFFFLNQQFITRRVKADRGSYFCNYIQKMHTNMKLKMKREKEKEKKLIEMYKR